MWSSLARATSSGSCVGTSVTITRTVATWGWTRTRLTDARSHRDRHAKQRSWRCHAWADCTTATRGARLLKQFSAVERLQTGNDEGQLKKASITHSGPASTIDSSAVKGRPTTLRCALWPSRGYVSCTGVGNHERLMTSHSTSRRCNAEVLTSYHEILLD